MAFLESISIARTFGKVFNYRPDEFWESFAIGLSNIVGSYFGSFPVTGSFSRTALNASTGVQTTFGGIITSVIVIFALEFMLSAFHYIPKAALGAIIICAAANMFDPVIIKHFMKLFDIALDSVSRWAGVHGRQLRRIGRRHVEEDEHEDGLDASLACLLTFVICFYGLAIGILVGLGVSIVTILYRVSHPNFSWRIEDKDTLVVFTSTDQLSYAGKCEKIIVKIVSVI